MLYSRRLLYVLLALFWQILDVDAQTTDCETTVDAGEDIELCDPVGVIDLIGEVTTSSQYTISEIEWSGPNIEDPTSLTTTASPDGSATYILRAKVRTPNLIFNGNFELGNTGFYSDYIVPTPPYSQWGPLGPEGTYMISTNPQATHTNFAPCNDHTSGNGNMMVVNGDPQPNARVWCQNITVDPDSDYEFSTWATSVNPSNPAQLQFSIDGVQLGSTFNLTPTTCRWQEFFEEWTSGGGNNPYEVEICIVNKNTATSGNDFALDDIYFGKVCEIEDEKEVIVLPQAEYTLDTLLCDGDELEIHGELFTEEGEHGPIILETDNGCDSLLYVNISYLTFSLQIETPSYLDCNNEEVSISAANSVIMPNNINFEDIDFQWFTDEGNIISGNGTEEIWVDEPGWYMLRISYSKGDLFCQSEIEYIEVIDISNEPTAIIHVDQEDCNEPVWILSASTDINSPEYLWSTDGGAIAGNETGPEVTVYGTGTYTLLITDPFTGCTTETSVELEVTGLNAEITGDLTIDCGNPTTVLSVHGSSDYTYEWSTDDGNILGDITADSVVVDQAGTYEVHVSTGDCEDVLQVTVVSQIVDIEIILADRDTITCDKPDLTLSPEVIGVDSFVVEWTDKDTIHLGEEKNLTVNKAGTYIVKITTEGGCEASDTIEIFADENLPEIEFNTPDTLNCEVSETTIVVHDDQPIEHITYKWWTDSGNIISIDLDTTHIEVDEAGLYQLEIIDTLTGCTSVASVEVFSDYRLLELEVESSDTLNCEINDLQLGAHVDSTDFLGNILWTTDNGKIISGEKSLTPTVNAPGIYVITVYHSISHCPTIDSVEVYKDDDKPFIIPTEDLVLNCKHTSLIIDKTGSTETADTRHEWEVQDGGNIVDGADSYSIQIDAAGTYVFTVFDDKSACATTDTIYVTEDFIVPTMHIATPDILTCSRTEVVVQAENYADSYTFEWMDEDGVSISGSASANVNSAGTYNLVVVDTLNGCSETFSVEVLIDTVPPEIYVQEINELRCDKPIVNISPQVYTQGEAQISWTTVDGNILGDADRATIQVDAGGTYMLSVQDSENGCISTAEILVIDKITQPALETGPDLELTCRSPFAQAYIKPVDAGMTITWTSEAGSILAMNVDTIEINRAGTYYVEIEDDHACTTMDSIVVTENIDVAQVNAGEDVYIGCGREKTSLRATINKPTDYEFLWINELGDTISQNAVVEVDVDGIFTIVAINIENGCLSEDVVTVNMTDSLELTYKTEMPVCKGDKGTFTLNRVAGGLPDYDIKLNGNRINLNERIELHAGNYTLTVEDALTCVVEAEVVIEEPPELHLQYPATYTISYGDSVQLVPAVMPEESDIVSVEWTPDTYLSCNDCLRPYTYPTEDMNYFVTLVDVDGCVVETTVNVRVDKDIKYYIPNAFTPNLDGVNDKFWPRMGKGVESMPLIEIYNRWGDRVYRIIEPALDDEMMGWDGTYKGKRMDPDVFIYKIELILMTGEKRTVSGTLTLLK